MIIGIYNEPVSGMGGTEFCVATLAMALSHDHQVEIVHHFPDLNRERFGQFLGTDLSAVRFRYVERELNPFGNARNPMRRYREDRAWHAALSEPYDLFVMFSHRLPPFCHASIGVLIVLFPLFDRNKTWPWAKNGVSIRSPLAALRAFYHDWNWKKRFGSYQVKLAISHFTRQWTEQWWQVDCPVVYPPVDTCFAVTDKVNSVLSVGRFAATKKQLEMVTAFQQMKSARAQGWNYVSVGGLNNNPQNLAYFEEVSHATADGNAQLIANIERADLKRLYQGAKIFWHAAGYGEDDSMHPQLMEHFGIVTVEAMAAGCVPIVINKGGQPELVQHGVNGFLWNTLEELQEYTMFLIRDEQLRVRMSEAARVRAQVFSRENFIQRFLTLVKPFLA